MAEPLSQNGARHGLSLLALPPSAAPVAHEVQKVGAARPIAREHGRGLGPATEGADRVA